MEDYRFVYVKLCYPDTKVKRGQINSIKKAAGADFRRLKY